MGNKTSTTKIKDINLEIRDATTEDELSQLVVSDDATFINYIGWSTGQKITNSYSITAKYMKDKLMSVLDKLETNNNQEKRSKEFAVKCIDSLDDKQARLLFAFITNLYDPPIEEESLEVRFNRHNPDRILPRELHVLKDSYPTTREQRY